jgi:hypothetical protein
MDRCKNRVVDIIQYCLHPVVCPKWNQEQERHKNKRPQDKKYTTHYKEENCHNVIFKKMRRNIYTKTEN